MLKKFFYILWDFKDGYNTNHVYLDEESADIGLHEHYSDYWIREKQAKYEAILAVSYFMKEEEE